MSGQRTPAIEPVRLLPERASLEHLRKEAKQRLKRLRERNPQATLAAVQLVLAREYGFASWRALKAHVERAHAEARAATPDRARVFAAARAGDIVAVRRAFEAGFDPGLTDADGRTVHQIAKAFGHEEIELLARVAQERDTFAPADGAVVADLLAAAEGGDSGMLARLLDGRPDLIDVRGGNFQKQTALHKAAWRNRADCVRLLLARGADARIRDHGDNATALHFAAEAADPAVVRMLVEAGADVVGAGDDHGLGVLGWATCLGEVRRDVAAYLLDQGATLDLWSAIALGRTEDVRTLLVREPSLLSARMSRNEHRRTALHHAAVKRQPGIVRLLLELGADAHATDDTGTTALAAAAQAHGDADIVEALRQAGASVDFAAALALRRYDLAEALLREDPARLGPAGRDTIALHLAVGREDAAAVRWLIDHGVDVDARRRMWDCDQTALHMAAAGGAPAIAEVLLDAGADPRIRDGKYRSTPLGWARFCGQPAVAALLEARGATE